MTKPLGDGRTGGGSVPDEPSSSSVQQYLQSLDADQLRELVLHTAGFSEAAARDLEVRAALTTGDPTAVSAQLVGATRDALGARGFIDYRRSFEVAGEATRLLDELQSHLDSGAADTVQPALLKALTRLRTITQKADDSSGAIGDACQRAADLYARSCRERHPQPVKLAKWLAKFRADSPGWPQTVLADFVDAFDDAALLAYRKAVAALDVREAGKDHWHRFELDQMLLELADHDGDVDRAVALLQSGERPEYGAIIERLLAAGRRPEAIEFVDRAVADRRLHSRAGNSYILSTEDVARLYLDDGRADDALAVLRTEFAARPVPESYSLLGRIADELDRGDDERADAWDVAEEQAARLKNGAVLIELALHEDDLDRAWAAADRFGPGARWESLARASADSRPGRAIDLYRQSLPDLLRHADNRSYQQVATRLVTMRELAAGRGDTSSVDNEIRTIREEYRRRPSMMAALDRAGLPG